jgi:hypothetical protein
MAKRTSRSQGNEGAPGAPPEPKATASHQAGGRPARAKRSPSSSRASQAAAPQAIDPQGGADVVASEIENPQIVTQPEPVTPESDPMNASEPTEEEIRHRAYLRFLERGASHGDDFNDWLEAERELKKL